MFAAHIYPSVNLHVIDPVEYLNKAVKEKYAIKTFRGDIERDSFFDIPFCDLIIFTEVLEHLNFHPVPTMKKIRSLLSHEGRLLLSTPAAESCWGGVPASYASLDEIPEYTGQQTEWLDSHIYQYRLEELKEVFAASGFEIVHYAKTWGPSWHHVFLLRPA